MEYIPAKNSSNVKEFFYDKEKKTLFVRFLNNSHYAYAEVPQSVYNDFAASESKGRAINALLKGKFKHSKLDGDD